MGLVVGDALGVPREFLSRERLKEMPPLLGMEGDGTHRQPKGTWSDDSSLALCLAECLCGGYDLEAIGRSFVQWHRAEIWTPHGEVFDIGIATAKALRRLAEGVSPLESGGKGERDNGNGSLMRILPLAYCLKDKEIGEKYRLVAEVSGITHGHVRSVVACLIYVELAMLLLKGMERGMAYEEMRWSVNSFLDQSQVCPEEERRHFRRVLGEEDVRECEMAEIGSSGYVLHTLEASLWCFYGTPDYQEAVIKAVMLGEDTDTTACVTGGLAGLYYGVEGIPKDWMADVVKAEEIRAVAERLKNRWDW